MDHLLSMEKEFKLGKTKLYKQNLIKFSQLIGDVMGSVLLFSFERLISLKLFFENWILN